MLTAVKDAARARTRAELHELRDATATRACAILPREELRAPARQRPLPRCALRHQQRPSAPTQLHPRTRRGRRVPRRADLRGHARLAFSRCGGLGACASAHRRGEVRARHLVLCGNVYLGDTAPALARKIMAVATYIVATETLGQRTRAAPDRQQCRRQRHELGARLFPSLGGPSPAVRRPGQLLRIQSFDAPSATRARMLKVFPQLADVGIEYSWGGEVDITLQPRTELRTPRAQRLLPAGLLRSRHRTHGHRRQARGRGRSPASPDASTVCAHPARRFPGRHCAAPPGPGAGDALLSAEAIYCSAPPRVLRGALQELVPSRSCWCFASSYLALWVAWLLYWAFAAANAKRTERRESSPRASDILPLLLGAGLIFGPRRVGDGWYAVAARGAAALRARVGAVALGLLFTRVGPRASRAQLERHGDSQGRPRTDSLRSLRPRARHPIYTGLLARFRGHAIAAANRPRYRACAGAVSFLASCASRRAYARNFPGQYEATRPKCRRCCPSQELGDLHRVERGALEQLIARHKQRDRVSAAGRSGPAGCARPESGRGRKRPVASGK